MSKIKDIIYVGDPQCSWCWGIAAEMQAVFDFARSRDINFAIMVGGLRVGGGQAWDDEFKQFLRHHWQQVSQRSGQKFGDALFDLAAFNYDTEPACRAIVAAKNQCQNLQLDSQIVLDFFVATQKKFYVDSQDPKQVDFYQTICSELGLDFEIFSELFSSAEIKAQTTAEFNISRNWGVTGYPTLLASDGEQLQLISSGYQKSGLIIERINALA
ncbi:MAG: DsbA family protein [Rhizobiales bacterium]|nr:DsbA family protein [Hyphomicrobiales bacterium]NRB13618.1 DsbA family protein [Hyphomicrobiales bacterium]